MPSSRGGETRPTDADTRSGARAGRPAASRACHPPPAAPTRRARPRGPAPATPATARERRRVYTAGLRACGDAGSISEPAAKAKLLGDANGDADRGSAVEEGRFPEMALMLVT